MYSRKVEATAENKQMLVTVSYELNIQSEPGSNCWQHSQQFNPEIFQTFLVDYSINSAYILKVFRFGIFVFVSYIVKVCPFDECTCVLIAKAIGCRLTLSQFNGWSLFYFIGIFKYGKGVDPGTWPQHLNCQLQPGCTCGGVCPAFS